MSVEELIRKQASVKVRIMLFQSFLNKIQNKSIKALELPFKLERTEKLLSEYDEIQSQIEMLIEDRYRRTYKIRRYTIYYPNCIRKTGSS